MACILSREFLRRGKFRLIYVYCVPSKLDKPAQGLDLCSHYQFPVDNLNDKENEIFFINILQKENVDVVIDFAYISACREIAVKAKHVWPFKLITTYHGDPFGELKELKDRIEIEKIFPFSLSKIKKLFKYICGYPFSYIIRRASLKTRFRQKVVDSDSFVLLCSSYAMQVKRMLPRYLHTKVTFLHNPVLPIQYQQLSSPKKQVVFVGRMDYQKRVDRLLRIWAQVENRQNDWELIIVGDGSFLEIYKEYSKTLSLKRVRFVGCGIGPDYMRESKILAMLSSHEGFPMAVLDALQNGAVPILFDSFASASLLVKNNVNGILVKPFSEKEFAQKLQQLLEDSDKLEKLRNNAYLSLAEFQVDVIADRWERLFQSI